MALDGGDSNAVRAGGAYVEMSAKNNLAPGLNAAKNDVVNFATSGSVALTQSGIDALKYSNALAEVAKISGAVSSAGQMYQITLQGLNDLLAKGAITADVHALATAKATKEYEQQQKLAKKETFVQKLTDFKGGLSKVAIGIGLVTAAAHSMWVAFGGNRALDKFNDQMERFNVLSEKGLAIAQKRKEYNDSFIGIGGSADQLKYLQGLAKQANDEVAAMAEQLQKAKAQYEGARSSDSVANMTGTNASGLAGVLFGEYMSNVKASSIPIFGEEFKIEVERTKAALDAAQKAYDQGKDSAEEYAKKVREIVDPNKNAESVKAVDGFTKSLLNQADALGKTAEEATLIEMGRGIFSPEQMKRASAAVTQFKADKLAFDVKELTKSFKEQTAVLGMSSEGAEIYKKKIEGATESQLALSRAAAIELAQGRANLARQDVYDEQAEKARTRMEDLKNSFATAFRNTDTAGSFDFGGGGQYTSMGDTLKDQLEVSRAIRKINEDLLKETKKLSADQFR